MRRTQKKGHSGRSAVTGRLIIKGMIPFLSLLPKALCSGHFSKRMNRRLIVVVNHFLAYLSCSELHTTTIGHGYASGPVLVDSDNEPLPRNH